MSKGNHVKITTPKLGFADARVFVDDKEIARVLGVEFTCSVDAYPVVIVKFWPQSVEVEGEMIVKQAE